MQRLRVGASFIGWPSIRKLYETPKDDMHKLLILCYFKTGGRSSEVLSLTRKQFDFKASKYSIVVRDMIVLKKYRLERDKRTGKSIKGTAQRIPTFRTFPILKDEELSDELIGMVNKNHKGLLFHYPYNRDAPMSRQLSWHRVTEIGEQAGIRVSDHYFRGQRVGQLKTEYGLRGEPLNEWIGWSARAKGVEMQIEYAKLGWEGLELEMLIGRKRRKEAYG